MTIDTSRLMDMNMIQRSKDTETRAASKIHTTDDTKLKEACSDFQAILIKQMLDSMRKTVIKEGILQENQAERIFEDMLYDEYAKKMSKTAGLGLDKLMYEQLSGNYASLI